MSTSGPDAYAFDMPSIIAAKRDGGELSSGAIDWLIGEYTRGGIGEEQVAALLMAIYLRGMDTAETTAWTAAILASGERLDLSGLSRPTVDKHSTGGVGDKISLPLVAVVAACGAAVPQLSGRGLGHTGGTLDKLESIAGIRVDLTNEEIRHQLSDVGAVICAAGASLAPADRKLYALRDITGTVESIPLIAGSIMSKKLAEGTAALVLDVKVGAGAFMKSERQARELASAMVDLGTAHGVATSALLTAMDTPLGLTAGNAVEVQESLDVLAGGGPDDVVALTVALAREMLGAAGIDGKDPAATLIDGTAMDVFRAMIRAQGGDLSVPLPLGQCQETVLASSGGVMHHIDAMPVGLAAWRLGAGRSRPGETVQYGAGVRIHRRPGETVVAGEPLFTLYTDTPERLPAALDALNGGWGIGAAPTATALIIDRLSV
ncbi:thymidine phosphorylase [Mycobacteroides salmoniphilum]|uniref:thymidine phosphorylase n=1 Tax=Mycobacteroides salmoniphilum TaxID=404941 RepID=UPI00106636F3|nr:thymidine phosphorylase [Mycobacteroides salmoniphilum]TDZ75578.1 Pyrimidine-nucleoside phosphorylase [Mycobacteroides salmoniphilum]TDZ84097.1 Pyrimidine-nucleoside phosphorylase [Mycobacteroides salmoniphilum]